MTARSTAGGRSPADPRRDGTSWGAVLALVAAGVVGAAQIGKGAAALPVLQHEFALSAAGAAWFLSIVSVIGAVAGALLGWLGQALGFRRQVLLGLLAIVATNLLGAAAGTAGWLLAARAGEGLGFVLVVLAAPGLLTEVTAPAHRRLVVGAWGVYMPLGTGLATLVVPVAVTGLGWRGAWLVDAAVTAGVLAAVVRWVPPSPARRPPGVAGLWAAIRSPGVICLALAFGFYAGAYLAVVGLLPTMLVDGGLSLAAAGLVTSIVSLANVPANLLGAFLQHRGVPRWVLIVAGSAWLVVTVWGVLDPGLPLPVRIASALAFTLVVGIVPSAAFSGVVAMSAGTASAGAAVGLLVQGSSIGQLLGPPFVVGVESAVDSWVGGAVALTGLAACLLVGGLLYRRWEGSPVVDGIVDNPSSGRIASVES